MGTRHITTRVPDELYESIERVREEEQTDRSTAVKRLLEQGVRDWQTETAVRRYRDGRLSLSKAAELAEVSLWRFLDILEARNVELNYSESDLAADLEAVRDR